jgi:hypothetical protein
VEENLEVSDIKQYHRSIVTAYFDVNSLLWLAELNILSLSKVFRTQYQRQAS